MEGGDTHGPKPRGWLELGLGSYPTKLFQLSPRNSAFEPPLSQSCPNAQDVAEKAVA